MDKNEIDIEMGKKFNSAAAFVVGASQYGDMKICQSDQLKLYGFYKQSTCFGEFSSTYKPSFWNFAATRKYWAWEAQSKLTKYQAMSGYVELVKSILPKWKYDPKASNSSTNPMTKTVSKYISDDAKEEDKLDMFFGLARDNKIEELISVLESTPSLINTTDDEKRTALHWAVDRDNLEATQRLLELGSDVNLRDIDGCTVLHYAVNVENIKMVALLCDQTNINLNVKDVDDLTPIEYSENTEILTLIREAQPK